MAWLYERDTIVRIVQGPFCNAVDISETSEIVGYCGTGFGRPWTYRDGQWTDLGVIGYTGAVNDAGNILVFGPHLAGVGSQVFLLEGSVWTRIFSGARAMNDRGEVVGDAFLYSSGVYTALGTLGGVGSNAQSINNRGQIAGSSVDSDYSDGRVW